MKLHLKYVESPTILVPAPLLNLGLFLLYMNLKTHWILPIVIQDDGVGFDTSKASEGIGLQNIKQRVSKIEGEITFDSTPGQGTTIILNFEV